MGWDTSKNGTTIPAITARVFIYARSDFRTANIRSDAALTIGATATPFDHGILMVLLVKRRVGERMM